MSKATRTKVGKLLIGGVAVAAVAVPLALLSAPAQAATTLGGCTVDPLAPVRVGTSPAGVPLSSVSRPESPAFKTASFRSRTNDSKPTRLPASRGTMATAPPTPTSAPSAAPSTIVLSTTDEVTNTEASNEEAYHRTSFRVASIGGVSGLDALRGQPGAFGCHLTSGFNIAGSSRPGLVSPRAGRVGGSC